MNKHTFRFIQRNILVLFVFILLFAGRCNRGLRAIEAEKAQKAIEAAHTKNLILSIKGIKYTEVHRRFDNGLSFSPIGFQLVPEWKMSFPSGDSVNIYSPRKGKFLNAPVVFDHDSIFNVAWAWLKLKYIKKDSLQFMVLHVKDNIILDEKVHVYMTFYTNDYIKNVLHTDTNTLWRPSRRDTLYIKSMAALANRIPDSSFAGTEPATLTARTKLISVTKETIQEGDLESKSYDEYLLPIYDITIHKAYQDFSYMFSAYVDDKGNVIFRKSNQFSFPEFKESTTAAMKGITDGYLKAYLTTTAGKTLGIPHYSIIMLHVTGYKK
ncbi:hypothetical protein HDF24_25740 [Mucilaginibacter sp. X4EP1]|uniref:hypothetical protein n=1 Tax=Mucilaginibacter sp. X4EP1 TaxID=2723092 RepID=UPI002167A7BA|nr:hypothetical protein [Mucilaginibacter sp. X4EP1]MCS3816383.1 hypothetical protein [Mucilaginibacter sp. X4EP1]